MLRRATTAAETAALDAARAMLARLDDLDGGAFLRLSESYCANPPAGQFFGRPPEVLAAERKRNRAMVIGRVAVERARGIARARCDMHVTVEMAGADPFWTPAFAAIENAVTATALRDLIPTDAFEEMFRPWNDAWFPAQGRPRPG
jgi:hypothetical protein